MKIYLSYANHENVWIDNITNEKKYCKELCEKIANKNKNFVLTNIEKNGDYSGRPEDAKNNGCDIYLAIHTNAYKYNVETTGCVCYFNPNSEKSKKYAEKIAKKLDEICPIKSNRYKNVIDGINETQYPKGVGFGEIRIPYEYGMIPVLIEINFHTYKPTAEYMINNIDNIANAISNIFNTETKNEIICILDDVENYINNNFNKIKEILNELD